MELRMMIRSGMLKRKFSSRGNMVPNVIYKIPFVICTIDAEEADDYRVIAEFVGVIKDF